MTIIKNYTDLEQSRKLAEILPLESADMIWATDNDIIVVPYDMATRENVLHDFIPCWSLAALLKYLSDIKPQEYTFTLTINEGKWCFGLMEYGLGYIRDEFNDNPVDACYEMILKLNEFNLL